MDPCMIPPPLTTLSNEKPWGYCGLLKSPESDMEKGTQPLAKTCPSHPFMESTFAPLK